MKTIPVLLLIMLLATPIHAGPVESVREINSALVASDVNAFQNLVDMDALLDQALDVFLAELRNPENAQHFPPMLTLMLSQAANQTNIRQLLLGETKAFVLNGIASGAFGGKPQTPAQQQGILAPLFANASLGRKEITAIGNPVADGNDWLMPMTIHDYGSGGDYPIIGRFVEEGVVSRLKGVENLQQIYTQIRKEMTMSQ